MLYSDESKYDLHNASARVRTERLRNLPKHLEFVQEQKCTKDTVDLISEEVRAEFQFLDDNARPHITRSVFHTLRKLPLPSMSPDQHTIEHIGIIFTNRLIPHFWSYCMPYLKFGPIFFKIQIIFYLCKNKRTLRIHIWQFLGFPPFVISPIFFRQLIMIFSVNLQTFKYLILSPIKHTKNWIFQWWIG